MLSFCRPKRQSAVKSPSVDLWYADDPPEATGRTPWCDSTLPFSRGAPTQSSCWILSHWCCSVFTAWKAQRDTKYLGSKSVYHQYIDILLWLRIKNDENASLIRSNSGHFLETGYVLSAQFCLLIGGPVIIPIDIMGSSSSPFWCIPHTHT